MNDSPDFVTGGLRVLKLVDTVQRVRWLADRPGTTEDAIQADLRDIAELLPACQEYARNHATAYAPHDPQEWTAAEWLVSEVASWWEFVGQSDSFCLGIIERINRGAFPSHTDDWEQTVREGLRSWVEAEYASPAACQAILAAASEAADYHEHGISFGGWSETPAKRRYGQSDAPRTGQSKWTVQTANDVVMAYARENPAEFPKLSSRALADRLGIPRSTVQNTPFYRQSQERKQAANPPKPRAVAFSDYHADNIGQRDVELETVQSGRVVEESQAELETVIENQRKDYDPSPLDERGRSPIVYPTI